MMNLQELHFDIRQNLFVNDCMMTLLGCGIHDGDDVWHHIILPFSVMSLFKRINVSFSRKSQCTSNKDPNGGRQEASETHLKITNAHGGFVLGLVELDAVVRMG